MTSTPRFVALGLLLALCAAPPAFAEEQGKPANPMALPADKVAKRNVVTPDGTLSYIVAVEQVPLSDPKGEKIAEVVVTSYTLEKEDPLTRPITYAFNGGPGAASAYLNFGAIGPKRLPFGNEKNAPSDPPALIDNPETWLAFTDLVFVDPVGTGYSRTANDKDDAKKTFWSVDGDVQSLSRVIAKHLAAKNRLVSPVYLAGESYGGFRAPRVVKELQDRDGVGVRGIVAISPVLDFAIRHGEDTSPVPWVNALPSLIATARERKGPVTRADLADAEAYATGDYMRDLMKGPKNAQAVDRIVGRVSELTGLDQSFVRRLGGKIDIRSFVRELRRGEGRVGSLYDANVTSFDPEPTAANSGFDDPVLDGSRAPLTRAAVDFYAREIGYRVDRRYELLSNEVNRGWNWGDGQSSPNSVGALREVMAADPKLRVIVAHGATDLVTPYMESKMAIDQLPAYGDPERAKLMVYPGGHMFYTRDETRRQFEKDVRAMYEATSK